MPRFKSSQEWLEQSTLLLEARPETTRITSRYAIKPAPAPRPRAADPETLPDAAAPAAPRGRFVLRTFDPVSGVNLRYRTTKAAEVGRLVQMLGSLARRQAGLPAQEDAPVVEEAVEAAAGPVAQPAAQPPPQQQQAGGGGGKGKKKKGKR